MNSVCFCEDLLHNGKKTLILIVHVVNCMLNFIKYNDFQSNICGDLKVFAVPLSF